MTNRKAPDTRLISYPAKRASPGVKSRARDLAIAANHKSFYWACPRHGMTLFSTAGAGVCRCCIADAQKRSRDHRNAAQRLRAAEKKRQKVEAEAAQQQARAAQTGTSDQQRQAYLAAMAAKQA
jgi:uncharacterized Zn finger protein (UPF0148 family)